MLKTGAYHITSAVNKLVSALAEHTGCTISIVSGKEGLVRIDDVDADRVAAYSIGAAGTVLESIPEDAVGCALADAIESLMPLYARVYNLFDNALVM